ncbi:MAG TPA: hypothetical protein VF459_12370 [Caulobacteraceae bacterium]
MWQLRTLQELVEAGVELARPLCDLAIRLVDADEAAGGVSAGADAACDAANAFSDVGDEINRLIRMQLRLEARLAQHRETRAKVAARVAELVKPTREALPGARREFRRGPLH